jgi:hypothetical protein
MEAVYYHHFMSETSAQHKLGGQKFILDALVMRLISGSHVRQSYGISSDRFYKSEVAYAFNAFHKVLVDFQ